MFAFPGLDSISRVYRHNQAFLLSPQTDMHIYIPTHQQASPKSKPTSSLPHIKRPTKKTERIFAMRPSLLRYELSHATDQRSQPQRQLRFVPINQPLSLFPSLVLRYHPPTLTVVSRGRTLTKWLYMTNCVSSQRRVFFFPSCKCDVSPRLLRHV